MQHRALCIIAVAAICAGAPSTPSRAQFLDFLFGGRPDPKPPASQSTPADTNAGQAKPAKAKPRKSKPKETKAVPDSTAPSAAAEGPPPPYDTDLLRLAEILGALTYLDELCAAKPPGEWRVKMQALLDAEATTKARKERLAGSYNRGFRDYERTYHLCTPNAQAVIGRFLAEGGRLAHDVVSRYGGS
ncbi:MAG: TIGR02301 family protein [Beijerinckiaceae bacterium]|nr:TIGR02301 family protein [Beijerinckiaceae bacterium]MCI0599078.1 TIGR02301 family protein [Beijerinckiaceae bacterium]MCI0735946.1 TIGR02301 family protein [Beijerinckiaceae bacterium]